MESKNKPEYTYRQDDEGIYYIYCDEEQVGFANYESDAKLFSSAKELLGALEVAMYEVKDWHEYNYDQIDSFDNNGTNNEKDMQIDIANSIYEKLQKIKSAIEKATH